MSKAFVTNVLFVSGLSAMLMVGCAETDTVAILRNQTNGVGSAAPFRSAEDPALPPSPPVVSARNVTLANLNMNNMGKQIIIKPGQSIQATLDYAYHCSSCDPSSGNQIIIGLAHRSAQACIYNGGTQGHGTASFEIKVPVKPGKYEVRFRALQAADCASALRAGWGSDDSPTRDTTIGRIIASKKAGELQPIQGN